MIRITNKTAQPTLTEKFLQGTLNSLLVVLRRLLLIFTLITLLPLLRLLGLLFLRELLGSLQDIEEVTARLCIPVSILLLGSGSITVDNVPAWQPQQRLVPRPRDCPGHRPQGYRG